MLALGRVLSEQVAVGRASMGVMPDADVSSLRPGGEEVAAWFDLHAHSLGAYAARRVGSTLARDIVAETFRVAWEQRDQYDANRGGERAWLFGIASNLIRRHWRAEERRLRVQARAVRVDIGHGDPLLRVDDRVDASRRFDRLVDAVGSLDPEDRDLLVLVAWEQMTSREVAEVLGIPAGTVRSRLKRIRVRLAAGIREGDCRG
jgi:RNA polymerase sigma-70 factor (ECF subfamily)